MPAVDSSAVERIDYAQAEKALFVTFRSGRVYRYDDVPLALYERFLAAPSKGGFLNRHLRDRYAATEVVTGASL